MHPSDRPIPTHSTTTGGLVGQKLATPRDSEVNNFLAHQKTSIMELEQDMFIMADRLATVMTADLPEKRQSDRIIPPPASSAVTEAIQTNTKRIEDIAEGFRNIASRLVV